jgi:hypothetical protein
MSGTAYLEGMRYDAPLAAERKRDLDTSLVALTDKLYVR